MRTWSGLHWDWNTRTVPAFVAPDVEAPVAPVAAPVAAPAAADGLAAAPEAPAEAPGEAAADAPLAAAAEVRGEVVVVVADGVPPRPKVIAPMAS